MQFEDHSSVMATEHFPVVCVGGSAGGLDAYIQLLRNLPADLGVAIVIVNHLRHVATHLHEILPRYTRMPVNLVTEGLVLQPNHVFIIPSQHDLQVFNGAFLLKPIPNSSGWSDVITVFLHFLMQHWSGKVVAVIVSGYDGNGAAALCNIKEAGEIDSAQKLGTAAQSDFLRTSIDTDSVDFVLSPKEIAEEITWLAHAINVRP